MTAVINTARMMFDSGNNAGRLLRVLTKSPCTIGSGQVLLCVPGGVGWGGTCNNLLLFPLCVSTPTHPPTHLLSLW